MTAIKVRGTVQSISVSGGVLALVTDDGTTYELVDPPGPVARPGVRVEAELEIDRSAVSIGMVGGLARVRKHRIL